MRRATSVVIFVTFWSLLLRAESSWNDYVYRLRADGCQGDSSIVSTAFKLKGETGIIAALHAVRGCKSLSVIPSISKDKKEPELRGPFRIERASLRSDLVMISSSSFQVQDGLELGDPQSIRFRSEFVVPGHAYGRVAPMESLLIAVHDTEPKPLRDVLTPAAVSIYRNRTSPDLNAPAVRFQGPLGKGQSGAPIIDSTTHRVVGVVNGGAGERESSYVWGMVLEQSTGVSVASGPGWLPWAQAERELLSARVSGGANGDYYYADESLVAQEVTLQRIDVKASGHFWRHPKWNIVVFIDQRKLFTLSNFGEAANNWIKNISKAVQGRKTVPGISVLGSDAAVLISCAANRQLIFGARATDITKPNNQAPLVLTNETFIACPGPGRMENVDIEMRNSNIFRRGDFVLHFTVRGLTAEENNQ